jgi:hypothetical protein
VAGCYEQGNESYGSIQGGKFLGFLSGFGLLKKDFGIVLSYFVKYMGMDPYSAGPTYVFATKL